MFSVIIQLSEFTPDVWPRLPNFNPGFQSITLERFGPVCNFRNKIIKPGFYFRKKIIKI